VAIMLVAEQRDQVCEFLLYDLHRLDEILALGLAGVDESRRLCRHYHQDLDLLYQLGWGQETPKEVYAVTLPSDQIRATFGRLHAKAIGIATSQSLSVVGPDIACVALQVVEVCGIVLNELPGGRRPRP
jgi:hypothetical protein